MQTTAEAAAIGVPVYKAYFRRTMSFATPIFI